MKIYGDLAKYWPLLSSPAEYEGEARLIGGLLDAAAVGSMKEVLELGCGGGNLASHLTSRYALTLTDPSSAMLEHSRALNPGAVHVVGDMRTLRLGRTFDGILVHDAVMYMTSETDLRAAMETAFLHCRPGGAAIFVPDCVAETFEPGTDTGGQDGPTASLRYLEWSFDPDPSDTTYEVHYAVLVREKDAVEAFHDVHVEGVFPRKTWLATADGVGFVPEIVVDDWRRNLVVARKPI
jgi:SAM-dependent methyltransferase